ncbi:restriction endonuclease subunit S [Bradyrhizobium sp. DN5]|uniref:restriction endonuclease subunit S n=1 Tax=Bradyrhizobium sp. DN5 TaxID=3056950 RepID=UPI0035261B6F
MGGEWQTVEVGEIADIYDGPHATPNFVDDGPVFLGIDALNDGRLDLSETRHVTAETYHQWTRRVVPIPGDLVFSYETRIGQAALIPDGLHCCLGRRLALARAKSDRLNNRYLLYYYLGPAFQEHLRAHTKPGSTVDRIHLKEFPKFPIVLPPRPEQDAIANLLGSLDDKIELNRRMAATLEETARALFKSWFVNFDPVRAKAEGHLSSLPDATAAFFPSYFDDGGMPEGWRSGTLADVAHLNPESRGSDTSQDKVAYVDLANTKWGVIEEIQHFTSGDAPSRAQRVLRPGDTILGTVRPGNGSYSLVAFDGMIGSTGFAVLRPKAPQLREFVYLAATSGENIEALAALADGGAYPAVRPNVVAETPCCVPSAEVIEAFHQMCGSLVDGIEAARSESTELCGLRATLLPRLISGELRIKDAENAVEAA